MKILQVSNQSFKGNSGRIDDPPCPDRGATERPCPDRYATEQSLRRTRDQIMAQNAKLAAEQSHRLAKVFKALLPIILNPDPKQYDINAYKYAIQDLEKPFALDVQA